MRFLQHLLWFMIPRSPRDVAFLVIVFTSVSAWIIGIQMRRKIRRDLGRKATDADLTSIDTWMKVDEVEQRKAEGKPIGDDSG